MLQICQQCGAVNDDGAAVCAFCDVPLDVPGKAPQTARARAESGQGGAAGVAVAAPPRAAEAQPAPAEPDWKREMAQRLEQYRSKRRDRSDDSQSPLPFVPLNAGGPESFPQVPPAPRPAPRPRAPERVEIAVLQPRFDFSAAAGERPHDRQQGGDLVPVAALGDRLRAGLLDLALLTGAYAVFLVLFGSLGGQFSFGKADAAVYLLTYALFYAQYFALFTALGGSTPGMHLRGLEVVSFDGGPPETRQLLLRSFGYLVSAATLCLGFLWALWDEDRLSWHDRMSQTYITPAAHAPGAVLSSEDPRR